MAFTLNPGAGFRRHDEAFLAAEAAARKFSGLAAETTPGRVLAAFKRASPSLGVPRSLVHLIDQLFARTQPQDWAQGCEPIVWPRNETLAAELSLSVRQVQNLLRQAIEHGLVSMKDSPNGHRGGKRGANGAIMWAYGIDLRPLGTRHGEFVQAAEIAELERRSRDELRRRLTIARKAIAQIAQTALEQGLGGADWANEADVARMAASHARTLETSDAMRPMAERLEARREALLAIYDEVREPVSLPVDGARSSEDISPTGAPRCTDSTTTKQPQSSKEHTYAGLRDEGSGQGGEPWIEHETAATRDLDKYGIDAGFIADVCRETCWELAYRPARWSDLVALAKRQAAELSISRHAWAEAVRVMGEHAAAAAVVSIAHKASAGLIEKPAAYLRGMSARAANGELLLGRTFHGIREARLKGSSGGAGATPQDYRRQISGLVSKVATALRPDA